MIELLYRLAAQGRVLYAVQRGADLFEIAGDVFEGYDAGAAIPGGLDAVRVLAPVLPSKIVAVGLNYKDHAAEQGKPLPAEPLIFLKPSTSVVGPGDAIGPARGGPCGSRGGSRHRHPAARVPCACVGAHEYVLGVTCVNDVTARDMQRSERQYTRAKGFDTFAPIGPSIAVGLDTAASRCVRATSTASCGRHSSTRQLIFPVRGAGRIHLGGDDPAPGRYHLDRDTGRHRATGPGDAVRVQVERHRRARQPGGARGNEDIEP